MQIMWFVSVFVLCLVGGSFSDGNIDSLITELRCPKSAPDFNQCISTSFQKMIGYTKNGIPDLGIPPLDPITVPAISFKPKLPGINLKMELDNITITGASGIQIKNIDVNPNTLTGSVDMYIPKIHVQSDMLCKGNFLFLPFKSDSVASADFSDIEGGAQGDMYTVNQDNESHLQFKNLKLNLKIGNAHINLQSDNPANQAQDDLLASTVNGQTQMLMDQVSNYLESSGSQMAMNTANRVLMKMPAEFLLPA